ncbi:MAG: hypothetical protein PHH30_09495 [Bacteroidales bacterium]|nr:hypothetical protein [Bacteroidales bacterium]
MKKIIIIIVTAAILCIISANLNAQHNKTKWMDGDWWGVGYQPNANNSPAWDIYLYYDLKSKSFLISYPDFPCSGHWKLVKANKHKAEFIEYITEGETLCNNEGKIIITRIDDNYITVSYFLPKITNGPIAFSTLKKTSRD